MYWRACVHSDEWSSLDPFHTHSGLRWTLSIFFSHSLLVHRYLSENRNWLDVPKQNTCMLIAHLYRWWCPISTVKQISKTFVLVNTTHICIVICYSLKTSHCKGHMYVERNKRTIFMNPYTWIIFYWTMQHIENDILYCRPSSDFMVWIFGCIWILNIRLHFVCLKCSGILIQAPSTIHSVKTPISQQMQPN